MAQSFWSKRKNTINTAGGYIKAADAVSRPTAILMTVLGILVVGGLLFGIFSGTRWAYDKLANKSDDTTTSETATSNTSTTPSITATSSTSTNTPSTTTPAATPPATPTATSSPVVATSSTNKIPQTGASSNVTLFVALVVLSYLIYRKKLLKN